MALIDNLVAYYGLSDTQDQHSTNHLTNNNTVTFTTGKVGNAAQFASASSQYLSIADNAALSMGDIDMTLIAWVFPTVVGGTTKGIVSKWDNASNKREYQIQINTAGDFLFAVSGNGTALTTVSRTATVDTWQMVVARHNAATNQIDLSVNNGTLASTAHSTGIFDSNTQFRIGSIVADGGMARFYDGLIDEVGIWKRYLSDAEVTELYNSGSGRDYSYIAGAASDHLSRRILMGGQLGTRQYYTGGAGLVMMGG